MVKEYPLVSIQCLVYNHGLYLRQCLDGFVMQKTTFKYEVIIHDDCSTDGSINIIKEYAEKFPQIIKPIYEAENQYRKIGFGGIFKMLNSVCQGKYIAFCEGDDYWIDADKLQKQVQYLEQNPLYGMVHTAFNYYYQNQKKTEPSFLQQISNKKKIIYNIIDHNSYRIQTCTVVVRTDILKSVYSSDEFLYQSNHFRMGDTQLWAGVASVSNIKYLDEITSVYRIVDGSSCRQTDMLKKMEFFLSGAELRLYLLDKFLVEHNSKFRKKFDLYYLLCKCYNSTYSPIYVCSRGCRNVLYIIEKLHLKKGVCNLINLYGKYKRSKSCG